jgi:hypothetical protein
MMIEIIGWVERDPRRPTYAADTLEFWNARYFGRFEPSDNGRPALWWNAEKGTAVPYTASWRYV